MGSDLDSIFTRQAAGMPFQGRLIKDNGSPFLDDDFSLHSTALIDASMARKAFQSPDTNYL